MIIVPDIHGRQFWRHIAQEYAGKEHIVFLGDYLDPYRDEGFTSDDAFTGLQDIVQLKKEYPDNITLLLGNHDLHYLCEEMVGSRYDDIHAERNRNYIESNAECFQIAKIAHLDNKDVLFTHAGLLPGWIRRHPFIFGEMSPYAVILFMNTLWADSEARPALLSALSDIPAARWGLSPYGSPVWADLTEHDTTQEEIPGYYQVFGHTMLPTPFIKPHFACLDCQTAFRIDKSGCIAIL